MTKTLQGIIHGKTVELADDPHLGEGEKVEVILRSLRAEQRLAPGEGIRRSAGMLANDRDADAHLRQILEGRKDERRERIGE